MAFRLGAFVCAARAHVPLIPVTLTGTRSLLRDGRWWPSYAPLTVVVGKPCLASGDDWQALLQLRDAARQDIRARLQEPDATT